MKTSVFEVHAMLSILSVDEVEKRIAEVPGVESATVNFAAGSATVRYDETRLDIADIRSAVRQHGYESDASVAAASDDHADHPAPGAPVTHAPASPKAAAPAPGSASADAAGATVPDKAVTSTAGAPASKPVAPTPAVAGEQKHEHTASGKS